MHVDQLRPTIIRLHPSSIEIIKCNKEVVQRWDEAGEKQEYDCQTLHSDVLGEEEEEEQLAVESEQKVLILASSIAARGVTLQSMKYAFLHPRTRTSVLHASGHQELRRKA